MTSRFSGLQLEGGKREATRLFTPVITAGFTGGYPGYPSVVHRNVKQACAAGFLLWKMRLSTLKRNPQLLSMLTNYRFISIPHFRS